ncbi:hypothetical protein SUNI508_04494 [Seiridium unicorne]|uniref:Uncharacterized protein n=1 Tax=Seiridium unicorne TaxID=138068 RepID=A0ABR2V8G1_9PEZI
MSVEATASSSPRRRDDNDPVNTFTASGLAAINWELPGAEQQYLIHPDPKNKHITFEACVENNASKPLSFFRLRIPVRLKQKDIAFYIHIPPNHILSLDWSLQSEATAPVRAKLNSNITCLRFSLLKPAQLIVPNQEILQPSRSLSANIIKALKSLATAHAIAVYLQHTTLSKPRLESIAEVVHSGQSQPVPRYCDLHRLYEGLGGRTLLLVDENENANGVSTNLEAAPEFQGDSPPSYDEIGPGPPIPHVTSSTPWPEDSSKGQGKRHRHSRGDSTDSGDSPSSGPNKRGPIHNDPRHAEKAADQGNRLYELADRLFTELANTKEVVARQEVIIKELKDKIDKLQDQAKAQQEEFAVLEGRQDKVDVAVLDLDTTVTQHGDSLAELEDNVAVLQDCCDEFSSGRGHELEEMKDELRSEVMNRLRTALES